MAKGQVFAEYTEWNKLGQNCKNYGSSSKRLLEDSSKFDKVLIVRNKFYTGLIFFNFYDLKESLLFQRTFYHMLSNFFWQGFPFDFEIVSKGELTNYHHVLRDIGDEMIATKIDPYVVETREEYEARAIHLSKVMNCCFMIYNKMFKIGDEVEGINWHTLYSDFFNDRTSKLIHKEIMNSLLLFFQSTENIEKLWEEV